MPARIAHIKDGTKRRFILNWRNQETDERDTSYMLRLPGQLATDMPRKYNFQDRCSQVEDQDELGSCTANMFAGMNEANELRNTGRIGNGVPLLHITPVSLAGAEQPKITVSDISLASDGTLSYRTTVQGGVPPVPVVPTPQPEPQPKLIEVGRLAHYYFTRLMEGSPLDEDTGATIRGTVKAGAKYGVSDEALWKYDIQKFAEKPPAPVWDMAAKCKIDSYHAIADADISTMKSAIYSGFMVGFGFQVYSYFLTEQMAKSAFLSIPRSGESRQGGHAVGMVGYDDDASDPWTGEKGAFLIRNSWGWKWGQDGYFWMSYGYVRKSRLASDYWVIQANPFVRGVGNMSSKSVRYTL